MYLTCAVLLGFVLDWVLGDPNSALHPVCLIGRLITRCERVLRRVFPKTPRGETVAGVLLWLVVCGVSFAAPLFLLRWLRGVHFWLGFGAETLLCWLIFARKSLADAGRHVYTALDASLDEGRKAVAMYVGRDTGALDREGVIKAAVETIAENTTDGVVAPLAYMRGRTLDDSFIILDEAQNTTREQMKMFLTRLGFGSKIVITGDITQIDLPGDKVSGLKEAIRVLDGVEDIQICRLTPADVVRHVLVQRIVAAYDKYEKNRLPDERARTFTRKPDWKREKK